MNIIRNAKTTKPIERGDLFLINDDLYIYCSYASNLRQFISLSNGNRFDDRTVPSDPDQIPAYFKQVEARSWSHIGPANIAYEAR